MDAIHSDKMNAQTTAATMTIQNSWERNLTG